MYFKCRFPYHGSLAYSSIFSALFRVVFSKKLRFTESPFDFLRSDEKHPTAAFIGLQSNGYIEQSKLGVNVIIECY